MASTPANSSKGIGVTLHRDKLLMNFMSFSTNIGVNTSSMRERERDEVAVTGNSPLTNGL